MTSLLCAVLIAAATVPDPLITTQTKISLWTTNNLRSNKINVDTADGVVTLHGRVPTAEQKTLAEQAARRVKGVRQVENLLQVLPEEEARQARRADEEIKNNVERVLKEDPALTDSRIRVKSVDRGTVVLTGKAANANDHLRAVQAANRVSGVRRVSSEVDAVDRMRGPTSGLDDARITSAVKLRLWTTPDVSSTEINVDTEGRVVTLFGIVPTAEAKAAAEKEAQKVDGVSKVENRLQVVAPEKQKIVEAQDKDLARSLKAAFKDREELENVNAEVRNGVVRLTGTVDHEWDKVSAVRIARFTSGVKGVEEQLTVRGEAERKGVF